MAISLELVAMGLSKSIFYKKNTWECGLTIGIVFEIFLPVVNGVVTTTINLAENLAARGHRVLFIAPAWKDFQAAEVSGIEVHYVPSAATHVYPGIRLVSPWNRKVDRVLRQEGVELLHVTGPGLLSWSAMKAARRHGIPVLHTFHTLIYEDTYLYYALRSQHLLPLLRRAVWVYLKWFFDLSDAITAPSLHACRTLQEHFPQAQIEHIHNGIDFTDFPDFAETGSKTNTASVGGADGVHGRGGFDALRRDYPGFNHKTFLFVGRLGEEKSVSVLLEAFRRAWALDPELRLFLVGDGPGRRVYEQITAEAGMEGAVTFVGRIDHGQLLASGLYQHARAMVTASTTENQPITVIEAMACGTPIIIPEVDGIMELLQGNGRCFAPGDARALARQLLQMANDNLLYRTCVAAAKLRRENFEGGRVAEQFERVYRKLTGTGEDAWPEDGEPADSAAASNGPADVDKVPVMKQDIGIR
ncbi:MAG: glycosyltransferase [Spirochaetia bacterium]|nr:glycosyltransferase [Spirochaetia bacterium]